MKKGETRVLVVGKGDPVSDLLCECTFALVGLHAVAAATGNPRPSRAWDQWSIEAVTLFQPSQTQFHATRIVHVE